MFPGSRPTENSLSSVRFADLQAYTGWSRPRVFFKHYLSNIEDLRRSVVSAGVVVAPEPEEAE